MSIFKRRESLNERLAREGGMLEPTTETRPPWDSAGIHGIQRTREWDAVVTTEAPGITGDRAAFVALPTGDLVVEEGTGDLSPLATALEGSLQPPYRAEAVRRDDALWAVAGRRIELIELPNVGGQEIELTTHDGERTLLVDGDRAFGSISQLERPEQVVRAKRVDGDLWEVDAAPL